MSDQQLSPADAAAQKELQQFIQVETQKFQFQQQVLECACVTRVLRLIHAMIHSCDLPRYHVRSTTQLRAIYHATTADHYCSRRDDPTNFDPHVQVHSFTELCWDKCVGKMGNKLDRSEQDCLGNCVERFLGRCLCVLCLMGEFIHVHMHLCARASSIISRACFCHNIMRMLLP